jgi:hypothetical protein
VIAATAVEARLAPLPFFVGEERLSKGSVASTRTYWAFNERGDRVRSR